MSSTPAGDAQRVDVWCVRCGTGAEAREAALRGVLASRLGDANVALVREPNGRPRLAPGAPLDLRLSFAQRAGLALVALRLAHDVGVDLEAPRRGLETRALAQDHFDDVEREAFFADPDPDRDAAFLRAWTRHEALAKACGAGIVSVWPADARERFDVRGLEVAGHFAAVASEGRDWSVCLHDAR